MIITATNCAVRVDTRTKGKTYSEGLEGDASKDTPQGTAYPYDSKELKPGESYTIGDDTDVVQVARLGDAAQPNGQDPA